MAWTKRRSRQGNPAPKLAAWHDGYKQGLDIANGHLISHDALYAGWEPNCCPSGLRYITYALQGDSLHVTNDSSVPLSASHVPAVQHFYDLLAQRDFKNAYAMLSAAYQQANPYDAWAARPRRPDINRLYGGWRADHATLCRHMDAPMGTNTTRLVARRSTDPAGAIGGSQQKTVQQRVSFNVTDKGTVSSIG